MSADFQRHSIEDFGRKLAHAEGILGAYLPSMAFDSAVQQRMIDCDRFAFSRLRSGKRMAANWELGRFVELLNLNKYGLDYRVFLLPFDAFCKALSDAGVGSYGASAADRIRDDLRAQIDLRARVDIHRDGTLNVGGIGNIEPEDGLLQLTGRDKVWLSIPLHSSGNGAGHLLLLHDFPSRRAMSCLMPSVFAPGSAVSGDRLRLPRPNAGYLAFPVGGEAGYRCLYAIQSSIDLAKYIAIDDEPADVPDLNAPQLTLLMDFLQNLSPKERQKVRISFGEYLLK